MGYSVAIEGKGKRKKGKGKREKGKGKRAKEYSEDKETGKESVRPAPY
jgi:hypothetical protein